ncbi:MAG: hypothetical protein V3T23_09175, partial [Nitrososphaerales archaeon]
PVLLTVLGIVGVLTTAVGVLSIAWALLGRPLLDLVNILKPTALNLIRTQRAAIRTAGSFGVLRVATSLLAGALFRLLLIPGLILLGFELLFRVIRAGIGLFSDLNEEVDQAAEELLKLGDNFDTATAQFGEGSDEMDAFIRTMEKAVDPIARVAKTTGDFNKVLEELPDNVPDEVIARLRRRFAETAVNARVLSDEVKALIELFDTIGDQSIQAFGGLDNAIKLASETTQKLGKNQQKLLTEIERAGRQGANVWNQYRSATSKTFELTTRAIAQESARQVKIITADASLGAEERARAIARERVKVAGELETEQRKSTARLLALLDDERAKRINLAQQTGRNTLAIEADIQRRRQSILGTRLREAAANASALFDVELSLVRRINALEKSKEDSTRDTENKIADIRRRFLSDESAALDRNFEIFRLQSQARRALAAGDADAVEAALTALERADDLAEQNIKDASTASTATATLVTNQKLRLRLIDQEIKAGEDLRKTTAAASKEALANLKALRAESALVSTELESRLLAQVTNVIGGFDELIDRFARLRQEIAKSIEARDLFQKAKADLLDFVQRVRDAREDITADDLVDIQLRVDDAEATLAELRRTAIEEGVEIPANLNIPELQLKLQTLSNNVQNAIDQSEGVDLKVEFGKIEEEIRRLEAASEDGVDIPIIPDLKPPTAAFRSRFQQLLAEGKKPITPELNQSMANAIRRQLAEPIVVPIIPRVQQAGGGIIQSIRSAFTRPSPTPTATTPGIRGKSGGLIPNLAGLGKAVAHLAGGGKLPGFGGGDKVPAMLEDGEFIMNKFRTQKFLPLLNLMNFAPLDQVQSALAGMAGMAAGGAVGALPSTGDSIGSRVALDLSMNGRTLGDGPLTGSSQTVNALVEALTDVARGRAGR